MDSINTLKGYGKVIPDLENQAQLSDQKISQPRNPLISTLIISALVGLTFVSGFMLVALVHESTTTSESPSSLSNLAAESTIKTICNFTRYPDLCFTSISSLNNSTDPNPVMIFNLSLRITISALNNLSSTLKTMDSESTEAAIHDCLDQVDDALTRINDSVSGMEHGPLTEAKVNDNQTWVSSALTDQETCLDGLEEMGSASAVVEEVKIKMKKSMELTSNTLAIAANFKTILDEFPIPVQ